MVLNSLPSLSYISALSVPLKRWLMRLVLSKKKKKKRARLSLIWITNLAVLAICWPRLRLSSWEGEVLTFCSLNFSPAELLQPVSLKGRRGLCCTRFFQEAYRRDTPQRHRRMLYYPLMLWVRFLSCHKLLSCILSSLFSISAAYDMLIWHWSQDHGMPAGMSVLPGTAVVRAASLHVHSYICNAPSTPDDRIILITWWGDLHMYQDNMRWCFIPSVLTR